jgi:hypothetical protein
MTSSEYLDTDSRKLERAEARNAFAFSLFRTFAILNAQWHNVMERSLVHLAETMSRPSEIANCGFVIACFP